MKGILKRILKPRVCVFVLFLTQYSNN